MNLQIIWCKEMTFIKHLSNAWNMILTGIWLMILSISSSQICSHCFYLTIHRKLKFRTNMILPRLLLRYIFTKKNKCTKIFWGKTSSIFGNAILIRVYLFWWVQSALKTNCTMTNKRSLAPSWKSIKTNHKIKARCVRMDI